MSLSFLLLTVAPPVAGVVLGYLCGGRLSGFRAVRIRALWLIWLAAVVQFAQYSAPGVRRLVEDGAGIPMLALVFAIVFGWLAVNLRQWPAAIRLAGVVIVLGAAMNALVIRLNGRMRALTYTEIADTLTKAAGRKVEAVFLSRQEQEQRMGAPTAWGDTWTDRVGYPARPHHAARYGLTTTTLEQWAAQHDLSTLAV